MMKSEWGASHIVNIHYTLILNLMYKIRVLNERCNIISLYNKLYEFSWNIFCKVF